MTALYRYERAPKAADARWEGRPVFNLFDQQGKWVGRVADETPNAAEMHARRHACVPVMEETLRAIAVNPEAALALHGHPAWSELRRILHFIDHGPDGQVS